MKEATPASELMTDDELRRFWTALASLLAKSAAAAPELGRVTGLHFLLKGPGSELLDAPLTGAVSLRRAIAVLAGEADVIETMKVIGAVGGIEADHDPDVGAKLLELAAARAAEFAQLKKAPAAKSISSEATTSGQPLRCPHPRWS